VPLFRDTSARMFRPKPPAQSRDAQIATSETARGINRGIILNLIRRRQPISRADLARASGLQRSTVSLITEELIRERLVIYGSTGHLPRGRRPTFLQLNDRRAILAIDLRPSLINVAASDVNGRFLTQSSMRTPPEPDTALRIMREKISQLIETHPQLAFEGIGISIPGRFDTRQQRVVFAPNLKWPEFDLKAPLERATGLPVDVENAANACVFAEVWFGKAEKARNLAVITVSEGVGVGIFTDGQLLKGANGMAGEFGHVKFDEKGPECGCGGRGCWEVYASNCAALRYYRESTPGEDLTFHRLLSLAEGGDKLALKALRRMAQAIGRGARMIAVGLAPEEIVFAGEFVRLWKCLGPVIEAEIANATLTGIPPRVRPAAGDPSTTRLRGAVALVLQKHFAPFAANHRLSVLPEVETIPAVAY
jgi:predicted NBD/HSP70 family sugar kinase